MVHLKYKSGRRRTQLFDPPRPAPKYPGGIAGHPSLQYTATCKYPPIPWKHQKQCAQRPISGPSGTGWIRQDRIDLLNSGDERQREFNRVHEEIDRSARDCAAWFNHPWLTEEWYLKGTFNLGWRRFERPYKMGYVTAALEEGRYVLGDRLVTVQPGSVRSERMKKLVFESESESESGSESEDSG